MQRRSFGELAATLPSFIWLFLFFLIPTVLVLAYVFKPYDVTYGIGEGWTLDTFCTLMNPSYLVIFWRTLWLSCATTIVCLAISLPVGYFLCQVRPALQKTFLLLVILPFWSSFLVRIFAWKALLHPEGMLKALLVACHLADADTILLYNDGAVLLVMIYSYLPFAITPVYTAAVKFDFQVIEAARDLGATELQAFSRIFLPGIQRAIPAALIMVFIPAIGAYVIPDLVGSPESEMIGNKIAQRIFVDRNLPQACLLSLVLMLAVLVPMAICAKKYRRSGEEVWI